MNLSILRAASCCILTALATTIAASAAADAPKPPAGFRALFNGKNLDGWHGDNPHKTAKASQEKRADAIGL